MAWFERRSFLGGVVLGGLGGAAATGWFLLREKEPNPGPSQDKLKESAPIVPDLDHARYMRLAIEQAKQVPNLPFGAVIVNADTAGVVAEGHNQTKVSPTFHGEVDAINRCAEKNPAIDWTKLVLYTTAEPCPMCQSAVAWAGISAVLYGSSIPFLTDLGWWQIDIRAKEVIDRTKFRRCALQGGVLEEECNQLFLAVPKGLYRKK